MQALHLRARLVDPRIDLVQLGPMGRNVIFPFFNSGFGGALFLLKALGRVARVFKIVLERLHLRARMMRIEDLKIREQGLVTARLSGLALE